MTKIYDGVIVLTYREWMENQEIRKIECEMCNGTGEHECECGDIHSCGVCGGSGELNDSQEMYEYEEELRAEIKRLKAWKEGRGVCEASNVAGSPKELSDSIPVVLVVR